MLDLIIAMYTTVFTHTGEADLGYVLLSVCSIAIPIIIIGACVSLSNTFKTNF